MTIIGSNRAYFHYVIYLTYKTEWPDATYLWLLILDNLCCFSTPGVLFEDLLAQIVFVTQLNICILIKPCYVSRIHIMVLLIYPCPNRSYSLLIKEAPNWQLMMMLHVWKIIKKWYFPERIINPIIFSLKPQPVRGIGFYWKKQIRIWLFYFIHHLGLRILYTYWHLVKGILVFDKKYCLCALKL